MLEILRNSRVKKTHNDFFAFLSSSSSLDEETKPKKTEAGSEPPYFFVSEQL